MARRAAPHRGIDVHYGDADPADPADPDDPAADVTPARPSKTQLKTESHALQTLGVAVAALSAERLARIEMPERLRDAITEYRKTRTHEGRRRQMQYVGKLMHNADVDVLREAVAEATLGSARETLLLHEAERWRDALLAEDDALTRWLHAHPGSDSQQLRSLMRAAKRSAAQPPEQRQPRHFRELFQFLKPLLAASLATRLDAQTQAALAGGDGGDGGEADGADGADGAEHG
jgi:ribosome-associated protein